MNQSHNNFKKLQSLLDEQYSWPDYYLFKFIVPVDSIESLESILKPLNTPIQTKASRKGNYISVSIRPLIKQTDEIIHVYENVQQVKGIVVL